MPATDLALLTEAARAAGDVAARFWRQSPRTWDKGDGAGPVTEADLAVDRLLKDELRGARPDYGWLSEETPDSDERLAARRTFIVDPIDGTRAFIAGERTFSHSLAVAEEGRVTAAAVYLPMLNLMFTAAEDAPARLNGVDLAASARDQIEGATLLTSRPTLDAWHWKEGKAPPVRREFRASLAYRLCLVAEGRFDAMMSLRPTWEWDIAAGDLIARRAGATVTDRFGAPIRYNARDPRAGGIVAAPAPLWTALQGRLA